MLAELACLLHHAPALLPNRGRPRNRAAHLKQLVPAAAAPAMPQRITREKEHAGQHAMKRKAQERRQAKA